jgi:hypothetical protein
MLSIEEINLLIEHITTNKLLDKYINIKLIKANLMYDILLISKHMYKYELNYIYRKINNKNYNVILTKRNRFNFLLNKILKLERKLFSNEINSLLNYLNNLINDYNYFIINYNIVDYYMFLYIYQNHKDNIDLFLLNRNSISEMEIKYCNNIEMIFMSKKIIYENNEFIECMFKKNSVIENQYFPFVWNRI